MFAVNPKTTNYTGITEQGQASHMTALKNQSLIPIVSFGYTVGAPYRLKKALGSLTLGGTINHALHPTTWHSPLRQTRIVVSLLAYNR